ncbi:MAG: multidrug effflux MFS transporter [bacterium]|nr:multidrug effflux MFS transporter [bacterium]
MAILSHASMTTITRPREYIVLYALLTSLTAISTDALLPALRTIETDLGASPPLSTQHVISLFIASCGDAVSVEAAR